MLSAKELEQEIGDGSIDTIVVAFTDMQGRLMGKRLQGSFFRDGGIADHGIEGCNYLLALEMEMDPVPGYEIASWDRGYGDFTVRPDLATLRRIPWLEGTALVLGDVEWADGSPVAPSPRQVLKRQVERAAEAGYTAMFGSELEFFLVKDTYEEARAKHYRDLTPSVPYILDYHILASTYDEPLLRQIRNAMEGAGIPVETSKGEAGPGQHEINFRYTDALTMADNHVVYKNGAKEIAHLNGCAITFMAKPYHEWVGSSCHLHSSLWRDGESAFAGETDVFKQYLAGQIACLKELAIFVAPTINSYKRYAAASWAPTTLAWGHDNRTCGFRIVGHGAALRAETRIPGADVNPYLAFAALIAAGLYGIENELELPPPLEGNAYESDAEQFPHSLREAIAALENGTMARQAFGDDVVDHYLNYARTEQSLFDSVVTCYERERMFEARMKPVIGITSYSEEVTWGAWVEAAALVPLSYVHAIEHAGGRPLVVPPSEDSIEETLAVLDGIVFSGGSDVDPAQYGDEPHPETDEPREVRDRAEMALLTAALERDMPVLAVCRGSQVLNVALGGDLVQHLPDALGHEGHRHKPGAWSDHEVKLEPESRVGGLLGERAPVKSHHHQGYGKIGKGLREAGWADDGTVEALEDPSKRFAVGVLWHPEEGEDLALFEALVEEAREYRGTRK